MPLPYEILIRCNDGVYSGSHVIDTPIGAARSIAESDLPELFSGLNASIAAQVSAKDAEIATLTASLTALESFRDEMVQRVSAVLQSGDPAQFEALAIEFLTPAEEKIRAEKLAQLAALKAELGIE